MNKPLLICAALLLAVPAATADMIDGDVLLPGKPAEALPPIDELAAFPVVDDGAPAQSPDVLLGDPFALDLLALGADPLGQALAPNAALVVLGAGCDTTGIIVCAQAIADAQVSCSVIAAGTQIQCTSAATMGGHGVSPIGLTGYVTWSGISSCSACPTSSVYRTGRADWTLGSTAGQGSQITVTNGSVTKTFGCITMSVQVDSQADATALVSTVVAGHARDTTHAGRGTGICK